MKALLFFIYLFVIFGIAGRLDCENMQEQDAIALEMDTIFEQ